MSSVPHSFSTLVHPTQLMRARLGNGRISFPVRPSEAIYANFEYVSGVPAGKGEAGVSLSRLKTIDNLIDRLVELKQSAGSGAERARIQRVIESLRSEMEQHEQSIGEAVSSHADSLHSLAASQSGGYAARPAMDAALFSLSA